MDCSTKSLAWVMIPAVIGFFLGSILLQTQVDVSSGIRVFNDAGSTGRALVVYHPGLSSFQEDVTFALVEGLIDSDWACDVTTAHREAPTDLSAYDALILGAPTYAWEPASSMKRYIARLGDFSGRPVLLLLTAAGATRNATDIFRADVEAAGGRVTEVLEIFQAAPNEELHGIGDPLEIARRAGARLTLP